MGNTKICQIVSETSEIEGWLSLEVAELLAKLAVHSKVIVEVGSWKGKSTITMALANPKARIFAIDPFTGSQEHEFLEGGKVDTYQEFQNNCRTFKVEKNIKPLRMTSEQAIQFLKEPIDMLFIDGSHEYDDVKNDFEFLFPLVRERGIVLFHDSKWPGVKRVLWENFIPNPHTSCPQRIEDTTFARKLSEPTDRSTQVKAMYLQCQKNKHLLKRLNRKLSKLATKHKFTWPHR